MEDNQDVINKGIDMFNFNSTAQEPINLANIVDDFNNVATNIAIPFNTDFIRNEFSDIDMGFMTAMSADNDFAINLSESGECDLA